MRVDEGKGPEVEMKVVGSVRKRKRVGPSQAVRRTIQESCGRENFGACN
jgi:hypothetical protein